MQVLREAVTKTSVVLRQPVGFARLTSVFEQVRFDGSDPKSSTSPDKHKSKSNDMLNSIDMKK